jgi:hypothetical protein
MEDGGETGETRDIVKDGKEVGFGNVVGYAFLVFFGNNGGVLLLLSVFNFIPLDNKEATNRSSPVSKGGDDVVEKETARAVFFGFLVFGCFVWSVTCKVGFLVNEHQRM